MLPPLRRPPRDGVAGHRHQPGTGGSSGLQYLQAAANQLIETPLYPELWVEGWGLFSG